jgi:UDP-N-acetylmuramoyl-L-alanyl-D-glutamate--2,6-diaminopimelate ligase
MSGHTMKPVEGAIALLEPTSISGGAPGLFGALHYDSRQVTEGSLFVALTGAAMDGHDYIHAAISNGATTIVAQREPVDPLPDNVSLVIVPDSRVALALIADYFYDSPSTKVKVIGVTGTNGKTTIAYLIEALFNQAGKPCGRIGTTGYEILGTHYPAPNTTPESADLHGLIAEAKKRGATHLVVEVSSHALSMHRVDGVRFETAVYTNLTRDHLDYHADMDDYFAAKAKLFTTCHPSVAVINIDDSYASRLLGMVDTDLLTYSLAGAADLVAQRLLSTSTGVTFTLKTPTGSVKIDSPMIGDHNVMNILAAAAAAIAEGIPLSVIRETLTNFHGAPGRFERVDEGQDFTVIVDYAHTDDALRNVLTTARKLTTGRLITVFGCGGDRDRAKRPLMGKVAATFSDVVVVTSDNPRTEDPAAIIAQIVEGVHETALPAAAVIITEDRRQAISRAIALAQKDDIVMIAGKGHEDYQIVGKAKHHFDDREEARIALQQQVSR